MTDPPGDDTSSTAPIGPAGNVRTRVTSRPARACGTLSGPPRARAVGVGTARSGGLPPPYLLSLPARSRGLRLLVDEFRQRAQPLELVDELAVLGVALVELRLQLCSLAARGLHLSAGLARAQREGLHLLRQIHVRAVELETAPLGFFELCREYFGLHAQRDALIALQRLRARHLDRVHADRAIQIRGALTEQSRVLRAHVAALSPFPRVGVSRRFLAIELVASRSDVRLAQICQRALGRLFRLESHCFCLSPRVMGARARAATADDARYKSSCPRLLSRGGSLRHATFL